MSEDVNTGGWDSEREKFLTAREKALNEQEAVLLEKGLSEAFSRAGGMQPGKWDDPSETSPFLTIKSLLEGKLIFTSSGIMIKDEKHPNGQPKTLDDKLKEFKSGSLSGFFAGTESQQQQQQQQTAKPSFTREQARLGKADIDAIASGKADIK